jgi:hypothetical protein
VRAAKRRAGVAVQHAAERHRAAERVGADQERDGVIYFIRIGDLIKIGKTLNLRERLAAYSYPDLELLATEPGYTVREALLHVQFASNRHRGEWFHAVPELLTHIADLKAQGSNGRRSTNIGIFGPRDQEARLSSLELASLFGVAKGTIRRWISEDKIPWQLGDRHRVYRVADVQAACDRRRPTDSH